MNREMMRIEASDTEDLVWIGLDTAAKTSWLCAIGGTSAVLYNGSVKSNGAEIDGLIREKFPEHDCVIGMEACTTSIPIARSLIALGRKVVLFDPFQVRRFASIRTNKTDTNDARGIAEIVRLGNGYLTEVHLKSNECFALRSNITLRDNLMRQRISTEALIRSTLRIYGARLPRIINARTLVKHSAEQLENVLVEWGIDLTPQIQPLCELGVHIREQIERFDREIERIADANDICRKFMAVPGVGPITAVSFYTAIENPLRFRRSSDVAAYLGLTPRIYQSGETTRSRRISRAGNVLTRTHLVSAATSMLRAPYQDCALKRWGLECAARMGFSKARVAVARKLSVVLFTMWRSDTEFKPDGEFDRLSEALVVPALEIV